MLEVERKRALGSGAERVVSRLVERGWQDDVSYVEVDTYYSRPDVDFLETVECLRVRWREGFAEITYKPASTDTTVGEDGVIAKRERNVALATPHQAGEAEALLEALGMVLLARVHKTRTTWRHPEHPNTTVAIDTIAGAGTFAEVEVLATNTDHATTHLTHTEHDLHLHTADIITQPYRDIVRATTQPT